MSIIEWGFVSIIVGLLLLILTGNSLSYVLIVLGLLPIIFPIIIIVTVIIIILLIIVYVAIEGET